MTRTGRVSGSCPRPAAASSCVDDEDVGTWKRVVSRNEVRVTVSAGRAARPRRDGCRSRPRPSGWPTSSSAPSTSPSTPEPLTLSCPRGRRTIATSQHRGPAADARGRHAQAPGHRPRVAAPAVDARPHRRDRRARRAVGPAHQGRRPRRGTAPGVTRRDDQREHARRASLPCTGATPFGVLSRVEGLRSVTVAGPEDGAPRGSRVSRAGSRAPGRR